MKQTRKRTREFKIQKPDTFSKYLKIDHLRFVNNLLLFSAYSKQKKICFSIKILVPIFMTTQYQNHHNKIMLQPTSRFKNIKSILNSIGGPDSSFQIATLETTLAYSAQAAWNLTPAHPVPHLFFLFFSHLLVLDVVEVVAPQAGKPRLNLDTLQAKKQTPL